MKSITRVLATSILLVCSITFTKGQVYRSWFLNTFEKLYSARSVELDLNHTIYKSEIDTSCIFNLQSRFCKCNNLFRTEMNKIVYIQNEDKSAIIDNNNRVIVISNRAVNPQLDVFNELKKFDSSMREMVLKSIDSIGSNIVAVEFISANSRIHNLLYFIDTVKFELLKIKYVEYFGVDKVVNIIQFNSVKIDEKIDYTQFEFSGYLRRDQGTIVLTPEYSNYELVMLN